MQLSTTHRLTAVAAARVAPACPRWRRKRSTSAFPFPRPRTASPAASTTGPTRPRRTWRRNTRPAGHRQDGRGAPEQANQLQDLQTVNKINALVIFPFESAALTKPVAQVKAKGVYVTVVDRGLTDTSAQDAYVAGDNTAFGKIPAEYIAKTLGGKGNVVALRGIATTLDNERMDAFNAVLKKHPDIKLLDAKYANWNRDDAFKVMQDYLTRFKQIDAVWAADDDMAVGVLKAIEQAKRKDIKIVFGGAGAKGMVKTMMDGKPTAHQANVSYSPKFIYDAIKLTAEARLKGEKLPATTSFRRC
jgi:ribose transport system substrate-binding protein